MNKNQKLEIIHRNLSDQLSFLNGELDHKLLNSLVLICKDLEETLYVPDFGNIDNVPSDSYSCPVCGSTNLRTLLMYDTPNDEEFPVDMSSVYEKTCRACSYTYHIDKSGNICNLY